MEKTFTALRIAATPRRLILTVLTLAAAVGAAGIDASLFLPPHAPVAEHVAMAPPLPAAPPPTPYLKILSDEDKLSYRQALAFQHDRKFDESDAALNRVSNPILKGAVLGERYLNTAYKTSYGELEAWLAAYADAPQAGAIYHLALVRKPAGAAAPAEPQTSETLAGFSNGTERSVLRTQASAHWVAGLNAYRRQDMASASAHFRALLSFGDDLPDDDKAAVQFWAYRSLLAAGDSETAMQYARQAASAPPSFYSILARHVTGTALAQKSDPAAQLDEVTPLLAATAVQRAIALKEIGEDGLAEQELRTRFAAGSDDDRKRLITLASLLDLPGAQLRMAQAQSQGSGAEGGAFYPMPRWTPTSGYRIEPALLFAIMRQESGFNPNARSSTGAIGVMQLMPATAHAMARGSQVARPGSLEPSVSMSLGQTYLERLMETSFIGDNLVFLTASYNAGPGTLLGWQHSLRYGNDPLLFIESIPYSETREYVLRVLANYWVYSEMLGRSEPASASALSEGKWPRYSGTDEQLAAMLSHLGTVGAE